MTDAQPCPAKLKVTIEPAPAIVLHKDSTNTTCGFANGSASVSITSGGKAPFSYLWNNGAVTATINALAAGNYAVTVTDADQCTANASVTVDGSVGITPPTITVTGPASLCIGQNDTLTASEAESYLWSNGAITPSILAPSGTHTVTITGNGCTATTSVTLTGINNHPPESSYTGNINFISALVNPIAGSPTAIYRFEAKYTDADGNLPVGGYPRLLLDYEGNGSMNDANDRTLVLQPVNENDMDVTDGKEYYFTTSALPESRDWKATVIATDNAGCSSTFGPVAGPEVFSNPDISIFANDITFSDSKPEISSPITVTATIHNNSGKPAQNFVVKLVNQFDKTIIYPNITVPYLAAGYTTQVSWNITTPSQPAWCPMQVFVDATNVLDEPNELDNQAIRPFTNGRFTLPGDIGITAKATSPVLITSATTISGKAVYRNTAVELEDPSCAGATVTATLRETGGTAVGYTNSRGEYSIGLRAPATPGIYNVDLAITDYTLDGDTTTKFEAYELIVVPCVGPDLTTSITLQPGSFENIGEPGTYLTNDTVNGIVTVTNIGQVDITVHSVLRLDATGSNFPVKTIDVPPLAAGAHTTFTLPAYSYKEAGGYGISATADITNQIVECYETNNDHTVGINVLPPLPDLTPWGVSGFGTGYICDVTEKGIGFHIRNIGGAASGPFNAKLIVNHNGQNTELVKSVPNINALDWGYVNFAFSPTETGSHTYTLILDYDSTVAEWNEDNNTATTIQQLIACEANLTTQGCGTVVNPIDPQYPVNITINAIVSNSGKAAAPASVVNLNVAGNNYNAAVPAINAGEYKTVGVTIPAPIPGNNLLTITSDASNNVFETNENDNTATASLCWDFSLTNIDCDRNAFISTLQFVGRPVRLATGLLNSGLYSASNVKVKFEVSGPGLTGWLDLGAPSSPAGSCTGCPIFVRALADFAFPQEGNYLVRMTADFDNQYIECNDLNNVLLVPVTVSNQPEYFVKSEYIAPSLLNPDVDEPVDLDITYENLGQGNGNQMELWVKGDNTAHDSVRVPGIIGGKTNTVRIPKQWSSSIRGIHIIRAVIDHDNEVDEPNELNNEATRAIVVGKSPNLTFNTFTVSNAYPAENSPVNITAVVKNNGYAGIYATLQLYYVDKNNEEVLIRQQSLALDTGGTATLITPWVVKNATTMLIGRIVNANPVEFDNTDNEASTELGKLAVTVFATNASCDAGVDGILETTIKGGNAPFFVTWSNGLTGAAINAGKGKYLATITDAKGKLAVSDSTEIKANALPGVTFSGLANSYQVTDAAAELSGNPAGGIFTGSGVSGNRFDPSVAGVGGPYTIRYTYTVAAGCAAYAEAQTTVSAGTQTYWYADTDHDGYGGRTDSVAGATQPAGYVANHDDCNDNDATIYPGATEICDGKDNDCDGEIDEGCNITTLPKILLIASEEDIAWIADVKNKLWATGKFSAIDTYQIVMGDPSVPSLSQLQQYKAILVWTNYGVTNSSGLGNNLAAYIDGGGGVVSAVNVFRSGFSPDLQVGGAFANNTYRVIIPDDNIDGNGTSTIGTVLLPSHFIMQGVNSMTAYSRNGAVNLTPGSYLVAKWADGLPLIAVKDDVGPAHTKRVDLGFFPPSRDIYGSFGWDPQTDGAIIMANALLYVSQVNQRLTKYYRDADGDQFGDNAVSVEAETQPDGYVTNNTDCDDNNASIHAPIQYHVDADNDGYGSTTTEMLCSLTAPVGYSTNNTDCNDNDASIHAPIQYYVDADKDGFGSTTTAMLCSSTAPVGYSTNNIDCNDNDASIHAPVQYYVDNDRDGYGSTTTALLCSSTAPVGYSTNNTDCDDNNANIHAPVQYYVDNDRDGYGSTTTALLCSLTAPVGYSTNNTDCNDNNANIHAPVQYYVDNDRDGYGSTTTALLCSLTAPFGYSTNNTDCDDNNANIHAPIQYYVDNDRDGYGSTTTALICSLAAPVGYSTNNTDCDDNNANIHAPVQYYVDNDRDGYGSTTTALLCSLTAPFGYSTNNTDCDDNNANIHAPVQYYVDNDRDGYGSTTTALLCSLTAPVGYSTNSTDCNDNNANIHAPVQYYVDNDRDGYGSTTTALLCSLTAPVGYSTNNTDCNDNDAAIHPGATEICDGKDNNCDGQVDEGCGQITMTITDASMTEGDKGKKTMNFDVVISQTSTKAVTVNYSTVNGTATAGSDYTAKTGTLTFKGKTLKQTIGISINGDKIPEPNEVFYINLVNAINAQVVKATGIGTIVNDDGAVAGNITVADNSSIPSVEAFPNPTSNFLDVRLYGYSGDVTIQLMNGEGKIMKQEKLQTTGIKFAQKQFNVASFAGGVYILMVIDEHGSRKVEKVIITR